MQTNEWNWKEKVTSLDPQQPSKLHITNEVDGGNENLNKNSTKYIYKCHFVKQTSRLI